MFDHGPVLKQGSTWTTCAWPSNKFIMKARRCLLCRPNFCLTRSFWFYCNAIFLEVKIKNVPLGTGMAIYSVSQDLVISVKIREILIVIFLYLQSSMNALSISLHFSVATLVWFLHRKVHSSASVRFKKIPGRIAAVASPCLLLFLCLSLFFSLSFFPLFLTPFLSLSFLSPFSLTPQT